MTVRKNDTFEEALLSWYEENRRILPWREEATPYHVWLSEIMLQQTRVEAVKVYYQRFLEKLPEIRDLAEAEEDLYMKLWEGLGYYSRVRNLHKGAAEVMEKYGGRLPRTSAELLKISGIGPYTASAIASIAFGERTPAVDGNLLRIFARLTEYPENIRLPEAAGKAREFYKERMTDKDPGSFNQALMDLGSGICTPNGRTLCEACPLAAYCISHQNRTEQNYPVMPDKKERKTAEMTVFVIHDGQQILLDKRPSRGLLAGMYEYPNTKGFLSEKEAVKYLAAIGYPALRIERLPDAEHIFTHRVWKMRGYEIRADEFFRELREKDAENVKNGREKQEKESSGKTYLLADLSEIREKYPIPTAFRKIWDP